MISPGPSERQQRHGRLVYSISSIQRRPATVGTRLQDERIGLIPRHIPPTVCGERMDCREFSTIQERQMQRQNDILWTARLGKLHLGVLEKSKS